MAERMTVSDNFPISSITANPILTSMETSEESSFVSPGISNMVFLGGLALAVLGLILITAAGCIARKTTKTKMAPDQTKKRRKKANMLSVHIPQGDSCGPANGTEIDSELVQSVPSPTKWPTSQSGPGLPDPGSLSHQGPENNLRQDPEGLSPGPSMKTDEKPVYLNTADLDIRPAHLGGQLDYPYGSGTNLSQNQPMPCGGPVVALYASNRVPCQDVLCYEEALQVQPNNPLILHWAMDSMNASSPMEFPPPPRSPPPPLDHGYSTKG